MIAEWLAPLLAWSGLDVIGLLLLIILIVLIVKGD